ncbi:hypothetical protein KKJ04_24675, partial [Xenorhabdus bovienii]|uniref:hypothetical protein n=1 Tax=Xenorhabdus bovienii TaxID=40576 RepID=UPI0023B2565F
GSKQVCEDEKGWQYSSTASTMVRAKAIVLYQNKAGAHPVPSLTEHSSNFSHHTLLLFSHA